MRSLGHAGTADHSGSEHALPEEDQAEQALTSEALEADEAWREADAEDLRDHDPVGRFDGGDARSRFGWIAPLLAGAVLAGWSGWFAWANRGVLMGGEALTPELATRMVIDWAVPVMLIGVVWLLAMRSSRAEASRFAAAAQAMNRESAALEARLKVLNRELSLAREFLAAQARDLESLGRIAAERISTHAFELQSLISSNGAQVEAIGSASETALGNMSRLRDDLPVIANAARDVANQVGGAGRTAEEQLGRLVNAFERLRTTGAESGERIAALCAEVSSALDCYEAQAAQTHDALLAKRAEAEALNQAAAAGIAQRMAELAAETARFEERLAERDRVFHEDIERRQAEFETREAQASEVLAQRLAELDDNLARRREAQMADNQKLAAQGEALGERLDALRQLLAEVAEHGELARASLSAGLGDIGSELSGKRLVLGEIGEQLAALTQASSALGQAIEAGARASREEWPATIAAAAAQLAQASERAAEVDRLMLAAHTRSSDLTGHLAAARGEVGATDAALRDLHGDLAERAASASASLAELRAETERLAASSAALAADTQMHMASAVSGLETAVSDALARLADSLGQETAETIQRALRSETGGILGEIESAAAKAGETGRETTRQLRDQLARVNELTGNLEQRVARARELAEDQVNNDFSRRAALISDSLNSAAIDIGSALSADIADTAWEAYLKGDRGIFTRRVVRLIDNGTSRDIAELYQKDDGFKANVSRYLHDFEAMLRVMLSTRDGHALSITMLGSDLGKLYVALAQAVQRLRS